jgi:hypothetical protein
MADFRRWILALAVVALLAGFTVPAGAQPVVCNTSVSVTPIVRAEGLAELVGDLVLYCTGGSPTTPGHAVPQVNITVFLNTNITSKVLGTQLASFGNGQTSGLDEALLIIDEPNSPNSPGVQCGPRGNFNGSNFAQNVCLGDITTGIAGTVTSFSVSGIPYPILNCGAVVGGAAAAPDGGPSGPGVCEIIAPFGPTGGPAPEHTYDGTVALGNYVGGNSTYADLCGSVGALYVGNFIGGATTVTGVNNVSGTGTGTAGIQVGATATIGATNPALVPPVPAGGLAAGTVTAVNSATSTITLSKALPGVAGTPYLALFSFNGTVTLQSSIQNADVTGGNTLITNLSTGTAGLSPGQLLSGAFIGFAHIVTINSANSITIDVVPNNPGTPTGTINEPISFFFNTTQQQGSVGAPGYSCGRPNVFQGRLGALQNANQYNAVTFLGVPLDPPGTAIGRTLRITNIRANAAQLGVSSTFTTQQILMNVAINGPTTVTLANPQQIVAYVNKGLSSVAVAPYSNAGNSLIGNAPNGTLGLNSGLRTGIAPNVPQIGEFVQCISQNPDLFAGTPAPSFQVPGYLGASGLTGVAAGLAGGFNCPGGGDCAVGPDVTPWVRFSEGFASSWKEKNIAFTVGDGTGSVGGRPNANYNTVTQGNSCANAYCYNGNRNHPLDIPQNVPGAVYNTETGFSYPPQGVTAGAPPNPNPPLGFQFNADIIGGSVPNQGNPFSDDWGLGSANNTGIAGAGIATQGTRLYLSFGNIPAGTSLWLAPVIYLFRQGVAHNGDPATLGANPLTAVPQSFSTGVMVLVNTDGAGADIGPWTRSQAINQWTLTKVGSSNLGVYEILYTDPYSVEYADVPVVLAYASNPGQNLPAPAPPNPNTTVTGGFAPFYTSAASTQPSPNSSFQFPTLPVPRFVPGTAFDFINIQKCACNVLFPFVANANGFDTGIAVANTSLDPGGTFGFSAVPQPGTVQFWYYGDMQGGAAVPGPQTSSVVQPGHVLTYVLSTGSTQYGLDGRASGLTGYIIAQSQFQYCHAYAFISAQGAGPTTPGTSEGYLGIILDHDGLPRTISVGENKAH